MTAGAQHGITVTLAALTQPGDRIATECLTYNGIKPVAAMLGVRLEGLPMDAQGLLPDAFEDACKRGPLRALYCIPTGHNPTTSIMPPARRHAIAAIALRHGVAVIEDDIFASLLPVRHEPISMLAGDLGCLLHIAGRLSRDGSAVECRHVAEVLAGMTDTPAIGQARKAE